MHQQTDRRPQNNTRSNHRDQQRPWEAPKALFGQTNVQIFFPPTDPPQYRDIILDKLRENEEFVVPKNTADDRAAVIVTLGKPTQTMANGSLQFRLPQAILMDQLTEIGARVQIISNQEWWLDEHGGEHFVLVGDEKAQRFPFKIARDKRPSYLMDESGARFTVRLNVTKDTPQNIVIFHLTFRPKGTPGDASPCTIARVKKVGVTIKSEGLYVNKTNVLDVYDLPGFIEMDKHVRAMYNQSKNGLFYLERETSAEPAIPLAQQIAPPVRPLPPTPPKAPAALPPPPIVHQVPTAVEAPSPRTTGPDEAPRSIPTVQPERQPRRDREERRAAEDEGRFDRSTPLARKPTTKNPPPIPAATK